MRAKNSILAPPADKSKSTGKAPAGISIAQITDGTSNTIAIVEVNDETAVPWTKPDDYEYDVKDPAKGLKGIWKYGTNVAFADGSVRFLSENNDAKLWVSLFGRDDGDVVNSDDLDRPAPRRPAPPRTREIERPAPPVEREPAVK